MTATTLPVVLRQPRIVLIGGGSVALQKAQVLHRNGITFRVVTQTAHPELSTCCSHITIKPFSLADVADERIVIDATGNDTVTRALTKKRAHFGYLLNVVDRPELCDFYFAALIERGPLKVAVSSAGASPSLAQAVRDAIGRMLPRSLATLAETLQSERAQGIIDAPGAKARTRELLGCVSLIGCGPGDVELLTLRAYRLISEADVVLYDQLISDEIMALAHPDALKLHVGKRKGAHSVAQSRINEMLIDYARKGLRVARLKAGDPYIFGRGSEEAAAVMHAGLRVDVIPGISSAIAGPAGAGIAPTARGYATEFSIVTAHLAGDRFNPRWIDLLTRRGHTTVVLMGLSRAAQITEAALAAGVDADLPCAIVSNATRSDQQRIVTTLSALPEASRRAPSPAVIVFGDAVALHAKLPSYVYTPTEDHDAHIA